MAYKQLRGIDVSWWQGDIDWQAVAADEHDFRFVFIRATIGLTRDANFERNWIEANKQDFTLVAPYLVFVESIDGVAQAQYYFDVCNELFRFVPKIVAVDVERDDGVFNDTSKFNLQHMVFRLWEDGDRYPIMYTSRTKWDQLLEESEIPPVWTPLTPLWVANYGVVRPTLPEGWLNPTFWQHTSKGVVDGIAGSVDMNWYYGGEEKLLEFIGDSPQVPE